MGGLESNCEIKLHFFSGVQGEVKFSRDIALRNLTLIRFEGGTVSFSAGESSTLSLQLHGCKSILSASAKAKLQDSKSPAAPWSYHQSFAAQVHHFIGSVRGIHPPLISGLDGIRSMEVIERCYNNRKLMHVPWLDDVEQAKGNSFSEKD